MTDVRLDRALDEAMATSPRRVSDAVVDQAISMALAQPQRRPRFGLLDTRAWPRTGATRLVPLVPRRIVLVVTLAAVLALVAGLVAVGSGILRREPSFPMTLQPAGTLPGQLYEPVILGLPDGRLLTSSAGDDSAVAWLLDPRTSATTQITTGFPVAFLQGATVLPDGRVFLLGWRDDDAGGRTGSYGWLYDPRTNRLSDPVATVQPRLEPRVTGLADGNVLIAGGQAGRENPAYQRSTELFSPASGRFTVGTEVTELTTIDEAVGLPGGDVLLVGERDSTDAESPVVPTPSDVVLSTIDRHHVVLVRLDPASGIRADVQVVAVPQPGLGPSTRAAARLTDGKVLVVLPGRGTCGRHGIDPAPAILYDPATSQAVAAPDLPHSVSAAVALADGRIVVTGSWQAKEHGCTEDGQNYVRDAWLGIYDPVSGETAESLNPMTGIGQLPVDTDLVYIAGTRLADGRVALVTSGVEGFQSHVDLLAIPSR